ncbi:hypothetical protein Sjap_009173 [Stephania japonica]|uniref:Bifunctional inhibitor/plant lipid transfer protein/seed storage helical domain-containing protein n=1 Tax=Stephania japonica TaxID=461633 RepID=A0AAP0PD24_9MAGN
MMKQGLLLMVVAVVVLSISSHLVAAAEDKCSKFSVLDFAPCLPAVKKQPNPPAPTAACCAQVKAGDLDCICSIKGSTELPAFGVDPNLALQIPEKCGLPKLVCP